MGSRGLRDGEAPMESIRMRNMEGCGSLRDGAPIVPRRSMPEDAIESIRNNSTEGGAFIIGRAPRRTPESVMNGDAEFHRLLQWLFEQPHHRAARRDFFAACERFAPYISSGNPAIGNGQLGGLLWRLNENSRAHGSGWREAVSNRA